MTAVKTGKLEMTGNMQDSVFLHGGFCKWKDACRAFDCHESTAIHKAAVEEVITLPRTTGNVGGMHLQRNSS